MCSFGGAERQLHQVKSNYGFTACNLSYQAGKWSVLFGTISDGNFVSDLRKRAFCQTLQYSVWSLVSIATPQSSHAYWFKKYIDDVPRNAQISKIDLTTKYWAPLLRVLLVWFLLCMRTFVIPFTRPWSWYGSLITSFYEWSTRGCSNLLMGSRGVESIFCTISPQCLSIQSRLKRAHQNL